MPNAIILINPLLPFISHATRLKSMELLVASCPPLPAPNSAIAMEVHDIFTVEAALIQIGPHRTVQKIV